jgi:hypothetical protein
VLGGEQAVFGIVGAEFEERLVLKIRSGHDDGM